MDRIVTGLRNSRVIFVTALVAVGCEKATPSPLSTLGIVTRADVAYHISGDFPARKVLTDSGRLAVLRTAARRAGDWHSVFDTPPGGIARAALYHDTTFLGVLSVGPDFIGASSGNETLFRRPSAAEADSVYTAIGLPPKPKL